MDVSDPFATPASTLSFASKNAAVDVAVNKLENRRLVWLDTAKGIGIVLVVYGHQLRSQILTGKVDPFWQAPFQDALIYTFHMPLFFFISGLTFSHTFHSRNRENFVRSRLGTLLYPYFLWSLISLGLAMSGSRYVNHSVGFGDFIGIIWRPVFQFWFLYALFICQMIAFFVGMRQKIIAVIAVGALLSPLDLHYPILVEANVSFPFFAAGIMLSFVLLRSIERASTGALAVSGVACTIAFVALFFWRESGQFNSPMFNFALAACGIMAVLAISALMGERRHLLAQFGATSMAIFILHSMAATGIRSVLSMLQLPEANVIQLVCCVVGAVIIPIAIQRQVSKAGLERALGLSGPKSVEEN